MRSGQTSWRPLSVFRKRAGTCIPAQVVQDVPSCAQDCVDNFIQTEYNTSCENKSSLDFLCVTPNPSGFTLGEAALRCVVSDCSATSSEGLLYNICAGIMNSVPETISTITATVAGMSTLGSSAVVPVTSSTLPPTIAKPSGTTALSTIETATGTPTFPTPAPTTSTALSTSTIPAPTASTALSTSKIPAPVSSLASSTTQAIPETASTTAASAARVSSATLGPGAIAGIVVGGVAAVIAVFAVLLLMFCLRKKRNNRRPVSQRWSMAFPPPPPSKDTEPVSYVPGPAYTPNQRFYAAPLPTDQRRSFWRKSINPADIGVAVSPGKVEHASSIASEKSVSRLLTNNEGPSMWPAPLMNFPPPPRGDAIHVYNEKASGGPSNSRANLSTDAPYETRLPTLQRQQTQSSKPSHVKPAAKVSMPAPYETKLTDSPRQMTRAKGPPPVIPQNRAYNAERARGAAITSRIPLTPIYDNGNFATANAYRWATPESLDQLSQPITQAAPQASTGLNISNATAPRAQPRKDSLHKSVASDSTAFEEDTTPEEEGERQIRLAQSQSVDARLDRYPPEGRSPIKDLAYPRVPRPAAVSRQAQEVPRPLAGRNIHTAGLAPIVSTRGLSQRYEMSRAGQSYLISETTSSSGPSLLAQRRIGQQRDLRIKTPNTTANALNARWHVSTNQVALAPAKRNVLPMTTSHGRPPLTEISPKAKVTPKTNSRGDLYLTVEE